MHSRLDLRTDTWRNSESEILEEHNLSRSAYVAPQTSNEGADVTVVGPLESRIETLCEACSSSVDKD